VIAGDDVCSALFWTTFSTQFALLCFALFFCPLRGLVRLASWGRSPFDDFSFPPPLWSASAFPSEVSVLVVRAIILALLVGCACVGIIASEQSNQLPKYGAPVIGRRAGSLVISISAHHGRRRVSFLVSLIGKPWLSHHYVVSRALSF
jgi:hypothetical protein